MGFLMYSTPYIIWGSSCMVYDMGFLATYLLRDSLCPILVVPVHGRYAVQLLHTQDRAKVVVNLVERLLGLLVDDQEGHRLPDVLELIPGHKVGIHGVRPRHVQPILQFRQPA